MKSSGQLIVFEGPDKAGKSTIADAVAKRLRKGRRSVDQFSFPGKTPGTLGDLVYRLHHDPGSFGISEINPTSLQVLHGAAHIDNIHRFLKPALAAGRWVVLDRYWWSTIVYGQEAGVDAASLDALKSLAQTHWASIQPLVLFLIKRPENVTVENSGLFEGYDAIASRKDHGFPVVTVINDGAIEEAVEKILQEIEKLKSPRKSNDGLETDLTSHTVSAPEIWDRLDPIKPTVVYDSYWRFAAERQEVLFRRIRGETAPWTADPIIREHRFTNAYRAVDRVSQYLIREVIYSQDWEADDLLFRVLLFKIFNKIETWELLTKSFGEIRCRTFDPRLFGKVLAESRQHGQSIYSGAYMMASGESAFGHRSKHENHLALLDRMIRDELPKRLTDLRSLQELYEALCGYPTIGSFLGFQYAIDLNYSPLVNFSEMSFVVPGPGALDGISKCFIDRGGLSEADIIKWVTDRQEKEFQNRGIDFKRLGNRPLQLIDCQNLFCEISKYSRVRHPEIGGVSGRTRIKQKFVPLASPLRLRFPPKWGINKWADSLPYLFPEIGNAELFTSIGK